MPVQTHWISSPSDALYSLHLAAGKTKEPRKGHGYTSANNYITNIYLFNHFYGALTNTERTETRFPLEHLDDIYTYSDQLRATIAIYEKSPAQPAQEATATASDSGS